MTSPDQPSAGVDLREQVARIVTERVATFELSDPAWSSGYIQTFAVQVADAILALPPIARALRLPGGGVDHIGDATALIPALPSCRRRAWIRRMLSAAPSPPKEQGASQDAVGACVSTAPPQSEPSGKLAAAVKMLARCQRQFAFYEDQHRAKKTPEADHKAEVNRLYARDCAEQIEFLTAPTSEVPSAWRPIETAPLNRPIAGLTAGGRLVKMEWGQDVVEGANGPASCWTAVDVNEHPDCWTDGYCWAVNEDMQPSDPPSLWTDLPPAPVSSGIAGEGGE